MDKFKFDQYVRYFASGIVVPITLKISYPHAIKLITINNALDNVWFWTATIFFIGITMYSIHRAIIYEIFYMINIKIVYKIRVMEVCNKKKEINDKRLYRRKNEQDLYEKGGLNEWFARIHFMYNTSWLILITVLLGSFSNSCKNETGIKIAIISAIVILIMAEIDDLRAMSMEKRILYPKDELQESARTATSEDSSSSSRRDTHK